MNKNLLFILAILIIILIAGGGFLIFQNQKLIRQLANQLSSPTPSPSEPSQMLQSPQPESSSPPSLLLTLATTQNAIRTNVNSQNYEGLTAYMTSPYVAVILQATECCGPQTHSEAVVQMAYINDGVPFDFNQESAIVKNLKAKNPELADKYIGISSVGEQLVAIEINSENRIAGIRMAVSWKLFSY